MAWFRRGQTAASAMGNARPRGPAELVGDLDPGMAAVRWVYDAMRIDAAWSVWEERGFTWWAHGHAQHVWSEPGVDDEGVLVFRLHARTDVLCDVDVTPEVLREVSWLNEYSAPSGLLADRKQGTLGYAASMWVHEETLDWVSKLFQWVAAIQVAMVESQSPVFIDAAGGRLATSAHPTSGIRETPDEMLDVISKIVLPLGREPSRWAGHEMAQHVQFVQQSPDADSYLAEGKPDGTAMREVFKLRDETDMQLTADTSEPHPLGNGMLVWLSLPKRDFDEDPTWANDMNWRELESFTRSHFLGSWVILKHDKTAAFITFYPNALKLMDGDLQSLLTSASVRARWTNQTLGLSSQAV